MILNLLRVEALKIEEMIKRSFSEHATQQLLPEHEKAVRVSEADLAKIKREPCDICDTDLEACHQAAQNYKQLTLDLHLKLLTTPAGKRMFAPKRLIVYRKDGIRTPGILLREGATSGNAPSVHVLEIKTKRDQRDTTDLLPYLPKYRKMFSKLPQERRQINAKVFYIPVVDVECVTSTTVQGVIPEIFGIKEEQQKAKEQLEKYCKSWESDEWNELDWSKIKELQVREILAKRLEEMTIAQKGSCLTCPDFIKHVSLAKIDGNSTLT
jgi:antiviral helicase SKI2